MTHCTLNVDSDDQAPEDTTPTPLKTITITHNRTEGTLIDGSCKGDGVWPVVQKHGFRPSRDVGLYIPHSRNRAAKSWLIDSAAAALRRAGFEVIVEIDNVTAGRSFEETEQERYERADDRTERFEERAARNTASGAARWEHANDGLPEFGQPILVGHHSERGHRAALERSHNQSRKASEEIKKGQYWANRAEAAGAYEEHRRDPGRTLRRINKLEASRRGIVRTLEEGWIFESSPSKPAPEGAPMIKDWGRGYAVYKVVPSQEWTDTKNADLNQIDDELGYWRHVIAKAAENGVKIWGKADFEKGDYMINSSGVAVEIMSANAKSVSIPWWNYWVNSGPLITLKACEAANKTREKLIRDTVPYDNVKGRISKAEVAELFAQGATVGEVKKLIAQRVRQARGEAEQVTPAVQKEEV